MLNTCPGLNFFPSKELFTSYLVLTSVGRNYSVRPEVRNCLHENAWSHGNFNTYIKGSKEEQRRVFSSLQDAVFGAFYSQTKLYTTDTFIVPITLDSSVFNEEKSWNIDPCLRACYSSQEPIKYYLIKNDATINLNKEEIVIFRPVLMSLEELRTLEESANEHDLSNNQYKNFFEQCQTMQIPFRLVAIEQQNAPKGFQWQEADFIFSPSKIKKAPLQIGSGSYIFDDPENDPNNNNAGGRTKLSMSPCIELD